MGIKGVRRCLQFKKEPEVSGRPLISAAGGNLF